MLLAHPDLSAAELAARLGRTKQAVDQRRLALRAAGHRPAKWRPWTAEEDAVLRANPGLGAAELGAMLGRSATAVTVRRQRLRERERLAGG